MSVATGTFTLEPKGPFSLDPVRELACGFLRGSRCEAGDAVRLAFPTDDTFEPAGVSLTREGNRLRGRVFGNGDVGVVRRQVARALAVDVDGTAFARLVEADPALRAAAAWRPGFRPVVAFSPYVMAGWCVLSQRVRMSQAAALQVRIAEAAGDMVEVDGQRLASFPRPASVLSRSGFPGVPDEKWTRLQAVARAALEGELDHARLMAMPYDDARERLMRIRGVGPWSADGILVRGCGTSDALPLGEPTLHGAVAIAYGLAQLPGDAEVTAIAEAWRPFRTWVSVLLISADFGGATRRAGIRARGRRGVR